MAIVTTHGLKQVSDTSPVPSTPQYAIAAAELTVGEYRTFQPAYDMLQIDNEPIVGIPFFQIAKYCNWLSERAGLTPCFEFLPEDHEQVIIPADYVSRNGYRIPTFQEWVFACYGLSSYASAYKYDEQSLAHYAWYGQIIHRVRACTVPRVGVFLLRPKLHEIKMPITASAAPSSVGIGMIPTRLSGINDGQVWPGGAMNQIR